MSNQQQADGGAGEPLAILVEGAATFQITLTSEQTEQFARYQDTLLEWNRRVNLTAITDPAGIQIRHFLDSLSCHIVTGDLNDQRLIDVGTGAGFPGLPLKILHPDLQLTLVESIGKKARFLQVLVADLGLTQVNVLAERAEKLGRSAEHRGQYDWAVARGVARMPVLAEFLLPFCRVGGHMLAQKGAEAPLEVSKAAGAITTLGGGQPWLHPIQLPGQVEKHYLVVIEKVVETPERYPRRTGIPAKRPL